MGTDAFLAEWHRVVAERDVGALGALLTDEISLGAPPYWQRLEGRELVGHLLGVILETIEDFQYRREWREGGELALEFTGRVGEHELQGIDLISLDPAGRIARFDVLMRPANTIAALREVVAPRMTAFLAERSRSAS